MAAVAATVSRSGPAGPRPTTTTRPATTALRLGDLAGRRRRAPDAGRRCRGRLDLRLLPPGRPLPVLRVGAHLDPLEGVAQPLGQPVAPRLLQALLHLVGDLLVRRRLAVGDL